jgi:hypothetical protein
VDKAGAAVSGATVVLINRVTNEERTTKTDRPDSLVQEK